jgi:uncharacterized protein (TIGR02145 family)
MRKLILTTAAVAAAIGLAGCGNGNPNILTDKRDGYKYWTVKMPDGKTWMAENLNYKTDSAWCYRDSSYYCAKYGRLYTWDAARKACPKGYHLPSQEEWDSLVHAVDSEQWVSEFTGEAYYYCANKKLKAKTGWKDICNTYDPCENANGTDDYGFSALPSDCESGSWWTATDSGSNFAYFMWISQYKYVSLISSFKSVGHSVRCVADTP